LTRCIELRLRPLQLEICRHWQQAEKGCQSCRRERAARFVGIRNSNAHNLNLKCSWHRYYLLLLLKLSLSLRVVSVLSGQAFKLALLRLPLALLVSVLQCQCQWHCQCCHWHCRGSSGTGSSYPSPIRPLPHTGGDLDPRAGPFTVQCTVPYRYAGCIISYTGSTVPRHNNKNKNTACRWRPSQGHHECC
jgi:hypothetical protein